MSLWVRAGDLFFTRGTSGLARLIRWAETEPGEEATWANHVGTVVKTGYLVPDLEPTRGPVTLAETVEALWRIDHTEWWRRHGREEGEVQVWRHLGESPEEIHRECAWLKTQVGKKYGWWRLLGYLGKRLTGINFPKLFFVKDRFVCSILAATGKHKVRITFGDPRCRRRNALPTRCSTGASARRSGVSSARRRWAMGTLLKTLGKAVWKVVRSPQFRELLIGFLAKKLEEQQARERPSEG